MSDYQLDDYPLADVHEYKDEEEEPAKGKDEENKEEEEGDNQDDSDFEELMQEEPESRHIKLKVCSTSSG